MALRTRDDCVGPFVLRPLDRRPVAHGHSLDIDPGQALAQATRPFTGSTPDVAAEPVAVAVNPVLGLCSSVNLQSWEGVVLEVDGPGGNFTASLHDGGDGAADAEATFEIEEVAEGDRPLLAAGAVFYWAIAYRTSAAGQRTTVSELWFRRLPRLPLHLRRSAAKTASALRERLLG